MDISSLQQIRHCIPHRFSASLPSSPPTRRTCISLIAFAAIASTAYATSCGYASLGTALTFLAGKYFPRKWHCYSEDRIEAQIMSTPVTLRTRIMLGTRIIRAVAFSAIATAALETTISSLQSVYSPTRSFDALVSGTLMSALCATSLTAGFIANQKIPISIIIESGKIAALAITYAATFYLRYRLDGLGCRFSTSSGFLLSTFVLWITLNPEAAQRSRSRILSDELSYFIRRNSN